MSKTAVLIPSYKRARKFRDIVDNLKSTTNDYTLYFILEPDDTESIEECKAIPVNYIVNKGNKNFASCINQAYRETTEPYMFISADDCIYRAGWLDEALAVVEPWVGVVGTDDMSNNPVIKNGTMSINSLVTREYLDNFTGTMDKSFPVLFEYIHSFTDQELVETAQYRGAYKHAFKSQVEHLHWSNNKAPMDDTYKRGTDSFAQDQITFNSRKHLWGK